MPPRGLSAAPPGHFTGAHASRLTLRTKKRGAMTAANLAVRRAGLLDNHACKLLVMLGCSVRLQQAGAAFVLEPFRRGQACAKIASAAAVNGIQPSDAPIVRRVNALARHQMIGRIMSGRVPVRRGASDRRPSVAMAVGSGAMPITSAAGSGRPATSATSGCNAKAYT